MQTTLHAPISLFSPSGVWGVFLGIHLFKGGRKLNKTSAAHANKDCTATQYAATTLLLASI